MKLLNLYAVVGIGVVAAVAACSSSSNSGKTGDGGTSSSGSSSGGTASSGSSSGGSTSSSGGEAGGPLPTITISSPTELGTATVTKASSSAGTTDTSGITAGDDVVAITLNLANFTLKDPGSCGSESNNCGHLHVFVDYDPEDGGTPCGEPGAAYNAQAWTNPAYADLTTCANSDPINGPHTVRVELHQDDHAPIEDPTTGEVIQATVTFSATGG